MSKASTWRKQIAGAKRFDQQRIGTFPQNLPSDLFTSAFAAANVLPKVDMR
jgi:hypothetical protein